MPVLLLECPECGHQSRSLMMTGTRTPDVFVCSKCGSEAVKPKAEDQDQGHPWETQDGKHRGCPCCGF